MKGGHSRWAATAGLLSVALMGSVAAAQDARSKSNSAILTLPEAITRGLARAPTISAAQAAVRANAADTAVAALRPNPTLDVEAENVAGTGVYSGLRSTEITVGVSLPLELGGKRAARVGVAEAQGTRARLDAAIAAADLRQRITQAYNEAAASQERARLARDQLAIAVEGFRVAHVRVLAGSASPLEEQRAGVARINAEAALFRTDRSRDLALANLQAIVGSPASAVDERWFNTLPPQGPTLLDIRPGNLTVAAAAADAELAGARVRLARSQRVQDVTVRAAARRLEATKDVAAVFGVSVPLPLFNNGRQAVEVANEQRNQAEALKQAAQLDAERDIRTARTEVANASISARAATGPALAAALEAARIARIGYREGKFGQLDLLEAERSLAETRAAAVDALAALHDAEARLERLTASAPEVTLGSGR